MVAVTTGNAAVVKVEDGRLPSGGSRTLVVLIPVFNDWNAVGMLLELLDSVALDSTLAPVRVVLVDDGSTTPLPETLEKARYRGLEQVEVLQLRRNLGHQRAIACGLCYIEETIPCRAVVVMDGDGEDAPSDIPRLLQRFEELGERRVIFAERARRSEPWVFKLFYRFYKGLHYLLTGQRVRVGNFSVLPYSLLTRLVVVSDLWNHYAAAIFKARLPLDMVPIQRAKRLDGKSHMNFVSLVVHGLSAMSVYGDRIGVRLLFTAAAAIVLVLFFLMVALVLRFGFGVTISPWAIWALAGALFLLPQFLMLALVFVFLVLAGRDSSSFLPIRDYRYYVFSEQAIFASKEQG